MSGLITRLYWVDLSVNGVSLLDQNRQRTLTYLRQRMSMIERVRKIVVEFYTNSMTAFEEYAKIFRDTIIDETNVKDDLRDSQVIISTIRSSLDKSDPHIYLQEIRKLNDRSVNVFRGVVDTIPDEAVGDKSKFSWGKR